MTVSNKIREKKPGLRILVGISLVFLAHGCAWAVANNGLGTMAQNIIHSFTDLARLITAGAYLAGLAFAVGAIMKFKQHKDNPTNIPIGTPIALTFIAAAMLFLPSILKLTGGTMFASGGKTAGPSGTVFETNK